jgi:hypothetical protein
LAEGKAGEDVCVLEGLAVYARFMLIEGNLFDNASAAISRNWQRIPHPE